MYSILLQPVNSGSLKMMLAQILLAHGSSEELWESITIKRSNNTTTLRIYKALRIDYFNRLPLAHIASLATLFSPIKAETRVLCPYSLLIRESWIQSKTNCGDFPATPITENFEELPYQLSLSRFPDHFTSDQYHRLFPGHISHECYAFMRSVL